TGVEVTIGNTIRQEFPEEPEYWFKTYDKVLKTGESIRFERPLVTGRMLELFAFRIEDEDRYHVAVIFRDITEEKNAHEEQKRLLREVEAEREKLIDVFQHAPSIMAIMHGPDHIFERVNKRYKQLVGNRELIGKTASEVFPEVEEQGFLKLLDQVYETGEAYVGTNVPVILEPPEGGERKKYFVNFIYQPIRDPDGQITGIFAQGVDLTERKRVEEELKDMNETLEEKVDERTMALLSYQKQLRSLATQLSRTEEEERRRLATELHDNLGQMLAVTKMKIDLMKKTESLADLTEASELMDEAIAYTRELMSDLKPPPQLGEEDISANLAWLAKKMKKYDLNVMFESVEVHEPLDEEVQTTLVQAVRELLFNVVKHANSGEARVVLSFPDDHLKITVKDNGSGFDTSNINTDLSKGGFGLFNIRERIDLLGGRTQIESVPGEGTIVSLLVPLTAEGADSLSERGQENLKKDKNHPYKQSQTKIKVLLVDDHEMMREGLKRIIEQEHDLTVVGEAPDGQSAVELAREARPDVVIMDINLPGMNGIDATEKIKDELPDIRVIGLSLHNDDKVKREMRNAGASAYLNKSNAFETLCATIRSEGMTGTAEY
ncbi:MAG TPA: response regulator, partial [Balneolaceae bacterium]|nr:response regulator [Balneolaceae bacterium]